MPTLADYAGTRRHRFPDGAPSAAPRISLITICLNAEATIGRAVASIHAQRGVDFEHVVVDGGSTDCTLEFVRSALRAGDFLLSEPDRGISDALNKGIALAAGEFIQFVHSDDWLAPEQLATALAAIQRTSAEFVFGDLWFYEQGRPSFRYFGEPGYAAVIDRRMPNLNHPTVLARRACFERIGLFDLRYRCAMDYDWFLRLHRAGGRGVYVPTICGNMNHDGVSNLAVRAHHVRSSADRGRARSAVAARLRRDELANRQDQCRPPDEAARQAPLSGAPSPAQSQLPASRLRGGGLPRPDRGDGRGRAVHSGAVATPDRISSNGCRGPNRRRLRMRPRWARLALAKSTRSKLITSSLSDRNEHRASLA